MQTSSVNDVTASFVSDCRLRLQKILERLEWSQEGVLKNFNTNSVAAAAPAKTIKPNLIANVKVSEYPASCFTNNSYELATPELQKLLHDDKLEAPKNFSELQANFSREQKLQIYEHVIENTKKLDNNSVDKVPDGEQSLAEIVAENKREAKRKKRKFRIAKPTRIEEVRAVVELQMQSLQQFIRNQNKSERGKSHEYARETSSTKNTRDSKSSHAKEYKNTNSDRNRQREERHKRNKTSVEKYDTEYRKSYSDRGRGRQKDESYKSNRSSPEKCDKRYRNSYKETEASSNERKDKSFNHNEQTVGSNSGSNDKLDKKDQRKYEGEKQNRSKSPEPKRYHKDNYYKERETYYRSKDNYERNERKRRRSLSKDNFASKKSSNRGCEIKNYEKHKDRSYHRRSRSREKHDHHRKKKYKRSRSRSKSRDYSKSKEDKTKHNHKT